ncbi:hypothetical protein B0H66DRAFT_589920 [Apodospora peruviana]|uniref:Uncharacterized protein n=1 Tax=Apodospora peruviana TaxID=516989 RepID=A0AAE0M7H3_9PEZI|nr:hypothetical protein B0H66DRAFT_589920 [Apodospora peruviana]
MAPVSLESEVRYTPLVFAASHIAAAGYLTYTIALGLYRSQTALGPAQDTRLRTAQRQKLTSAFGSLAALSLILAIGSGISYLTLSYKVWASERGVAVPNSLFGGWHAQENANTTTPVGIYPFSWLNDTPIYRDALEIIAERSRRLWWAQQLGLSAISWSMLLAIEGRRRKVPYLWAYSLLAQLVNLSFAQNLFYVAMLLSPSTVPVPESRIAKFVDRAFPPKPANWVPKPLLFLGLLVLNYAAALYVPYTAGHRIFLKATAIAKFLQFTPLIMTTVVPASWGVVYPTPRNAYSAFTKLFQVMSIAGALLHGKTTLVSLLYNLPEAYKHRHSIHIPFDTEKRTAWERSATAIEKVVGSINDHPVVAAAGKDVLLCGLSLGLWAAVRAMDVGDMLQSVIPSYTAISESSPVKEAAAAVSSVATATIESPPAEEDGEAAKPDLSMSSLRRSGRSAKPRFSSVSSSTEEVQTPRRRGRLRKAAKAEPTPEPDPEEVLGDATYEPSPAVEASVIQGDVVPDDDFDWESASLAWGLTALGGLGAGSAAVFGAECISR